nr:hypothetical protein [uncultured Sphaerochaeta sp.]
MATNVQKLIASAGGRYMTITPANVGVTATDCMLVALDGETVLYRFPVGAEAQEVDLELIGDCFFICSEQEYSYSRSATSNVAVGGDLSIAGTLKMILLELKKKLANINLAIVGFKNLSDAQAVEIDALETRAGEIEAQIANIQNGIVALESFVSVQGNNIAENASAISALEELTDGYKVSLQSEVDTLGVTVANHAEELQIQENTLHDTAQLIMGQMEKIQTLESDVQALETLTAGINSTIQTTVNTLVADVESLETAKANHASRLGTAEAEIQALKNLTASHTGELSAILSELEGLTGKVEGLEVGEEEVSTAITALQTVDSGLVTRVAGCEGMVDQLLTAFTDLLAQVQAELDNIDVPIPSNPYSDEKFEVEIQTGHPMFNQMWSQGYRGHLSYDGALFTGDYASDKTYNFANAGTCKIKHGYIEQGVITPAMLISV